MTDIHLYCTCCVCTLVYAQVGLQDMNISPAVVSKFVKELRSYKRDVQTTVFFMKPNNLQTEAIQLLKSSHSRIKTVK